ncbi:MAG: transglutaminase family protein [Solirubrobacterales bacterium]|nr:transglutaminase family protein [Solirubrobacterales bacterium]
MIYAVRHSTKYSYEAPVSASYGQLHMLPREAPGQLCRRAEVHVSPTPEVYRERIDFFGNRVSHFVLQEPHTELAISAASVVEVDDRSGAVSLFGERSWESVRDAVADHQVDYQISQYVLDSPLVEAAEQYLDYARDCFGPGAGLLAAVSALSTRIHQDFAYTPGATSVSTPLAEVFERREGVCQDLAHLGIACLRALGLPARYVSGYLETLAPPGQPKLTGVDGSHAWLSVYMPDAGWIDVDPTNDQLVNGRYVVTAVGRDYSDVPPMQGVIYTEGKTEALEVKVDVTPIDPDG